MRKKIVSLLLCAALAVSVTGCAENKGESVKENTEGTEFVAGENGTESVAGGNKTTSGKSSASIEYDVNEYVTLGDYKNLKVTIDRDYEVNEQIIADYVDHNVLVNYPYYKDLDKTTVESGDFVDIDYEGTRDGEAFAGGTASGSVIEIGNAGFIDGFEDGLIGMKVGEEKDLNLTFPEEYENNPDLAGVDVVFHVKVNRIVEKVEMSYDKLTDEYVVYLSEKTGMSYKTAKDMIADITSYLESNAQSSKNAAIRSAVIAQLQQVCTVNGAPQELNEIKYAEALEQYESFYCQGDMTLEAYVEGNMGTTYEEFLKQVRTEVEQDTQIQMILEAIAQKENLEYEEADYEAYINNLVTNNGYENTDQLYLNYADDVAVGEKHMRKIFLCNMALQSVADDADVTVEVSTEGDNTEAVNDTESLEDTEQ